MKRRLAHNSVDYTGQTMKFWTIIKYEFTKNKKQHYLCECKCGKRVIKNISRILYGYSNSCGCNNIENHITHGKSNKRVYNIWQNIKNRCLNPKSTQWKWYGGRGIKICQRWKISFSNFLKDMGEPPTNKHSIDRIKNEGNYKKSNCRWATAKEQANNRRLPEPPKNI